MDHIVREETDPHLHPSANNHFGTNSQKLSILLRDESNRLFEVRDLQDSDIIVLLTPVVPLISQNPGEATDPFESFESSLSNRHPWIHRILYHEKNGITEAHTDLVKRGQVIIFCFAPKRDEDFPVQIAKFLFSISENKPIIIVVCCKPLDSRRDIPFPTVIQTFGYSPAALEATSVLIFGEDALSSAISLYLNAPVDTQVPRVWPVELWDRARDIGSILTLWRQCVGMPFLIDSEILGAILERPEYNKNFVIRHPMSGDTLGFCATHLSPADRSGEKHVACLALIFVHIFHRNEGIGMSLYRFAIQELKKAQGVIRIKLGSSFPRILYGPLEKMADHDIWFRRRGWQFYRNLPGHGRTVCDLVLDLSDWLYNEAMTSSFSFRWCSHGDKGKVLNLLESESFDVYVKMGWYDQYIKLLNASNLDDIVLALEDKVIVAMAITYTSSNEVKTQYNLPWAGIIGNDVGGLTCVFLPSDTAAKAKLEIQTGLLDIAVMKLKNQNKKRLYWDGIVENIDDLKMLGFQEWAKYREIWRDI
ncbi:putative acyl- n-acyltransferase [Erysiphe necator]|uniref:Putative acyl-n-acyltransferase n=1 Tax=Uncinula necator TaxID=52586 RepID=A0A0B1PBR2_UNCNE|nr:putative acyl- n-acyltransferase [Erysiphe necator]